MLLPDDLIINKNCSKSMMDTHKRYKSSVMASMNVNKKTVSRWGIFKLGKKFDKKNYLIKDVIKNLNETNLQIALVANKSKLIGTVTDGDIRRALLKGFSLNEKVSRIMKKNSITVGKNTSYRTARDLMRSKSILQILSKIFLRCSIELVPRCKSLIKIILDLFLTKSELKVKNFKLIFAPFEYA